MNTRMEMEMVAVRKLASPWDNPPGFGLQAMSVRGDGITRTSFLASAHATRKDGVGLAIGHHEGSDPHGGNHGDFTLDCRGALGYDKERTCSGVLIRGACGLERARILGPHGRRPVEAFGVHQINRDPHGDYHGGGRIVDVEVVILGRGSYVTGVCIGQRAHPGIPLLETRVIRPEVVGPGGVWAGFTGLQRVVYEEPTCSGVLNAYNCDSGPMDGVHLYDVRWECEYAAVRLAVDPLDTGPRYKRGLYVKGGTVRFRGPGPFRILECWDDLGTGEIGDIHFEDVTFEAPEGAQCIILSTTARTHGIIRFTRCRFPERTFHATKTMDTAKEVQNRLLVDGTRMVNAFQEYVP